MPEAQQRDLRLTLALVWFGGVVLYVVYAAATFSGLYAWIAEWQNEHMSGYDPVLTIIVMLFALLGPVYLLLPPHLRHKPLTGAPGTTPQAALSPAESYRKTRRVVLPLALASLLTGLAAGAIAFWQAHRTPVVQSLDLATVSPETKITADQLIVAGVPRSTLSEIVTETHNGSKSSTLYTPLVAPGWQPGEPIRFVMREGLADNVPPLLDPRATPLPFGPAALFRHALPGLVRTAWQRDGLLLSPDLLVLDRNLHNAYVTLVVTCFFGVLFGGFMLAMLFVSGRKVAG